MSARSNGTAKTATTIESAPTTTAKETHMPADNNTVVARTYESLVETNPAVMTIGGLLTVTFPQQDKDGNHTGKVWAHILTKSGNEVGVLVADGILNGKTNTWAVAHGIAQVSTYSKQTTKGAWYRVASISITEPVMFATYTIADFNGGDKATLVDHINHNPVVVNRGNEIALGEIEAYVPFQVCRTEGTWTHEQVPVWENGKPTDKTRTQYSIVNGKYFNRVSLVPGSVMPRKGDNVLVEGGLNVTVGKEGQGATYVSLVGARVVLVNGVAA